MLLQFLLLSLLPPTALAIDSLAWTASDTPGPSTLYTGPQNVPIASLDNGVNAYFQSDGNFVIYANGGTDVADHVWDSGTDNLDCYNHVCALLFQSSGDLVLQQDGNTVWHTDTAGQGRTLVVLNQRPWLAVFDGDGQEIWPWVRESQEPGGGGTSGGQGLCASGQCVACWGAGDCSKPISPSVG